MPSLTGRKLEDLVQEKLSSLGLTCVHRLDQARLQDLDPDGPHTSGDHLELDFLITHGHTCVVGEVDGRQNAADVRGKFARFRRHFALLKRLRLESAFWRALGVRGRALRAFQSVTRLQAMYVASRVQRFDVALPQDTGILTLYQADWKVLRSYADAIAQYGRPYVLSLLGLREDRGQHPLELSKAQHRLMITQDKRVASGRVGSADIFTFEVDPYDVLPRSVVYRRDQLPDLSSTSSDKYQRPLIQRKLAEIRRKLLAAPNFMFPNSILVVLSPGCRFDSAASALVIPEEYGAIEVIDGQHRLFSYADEAVARRVQSTARVMITAIQFKESDFKKLGRYKACTFVEINMTQTRIRRSHIDAIAYEILGDVRPRALAAQVVLRVNERNGGMHGLFDTNQTGLGRIRTNTVLDAMERLFDTRKIAALRGRRGPEATYRVGLSHLFGAGLDQLTRPPKLIQHGVICLSRYGNLLRRAFPQDWPQRDRRTGSALEYAKMIAALVLLLEQFIIDGFDWAAVEAELTRIRLNIERLRGLSNYRGVLLVPGSGIPDDGPSVREDFLFLNTNRSAPTPIHSVMGRVRSP